MSDATDKLEPYNEMLFTALSGLRLAFVEVVNNHKDPQVLLDAIRELDSVRTIINSAENLGVAIGIGQFQIGLFTLTGDPEKDLGQKRTKFPES